ncbi:MAG: hypothetical protein K9G46_02740 [Flavobacteriales bacterium]|nr:hypothetical protein [Flavobacteriales bacterium]
MIIKILPVKTYNAVANVVAYIATDKGHIEDHHTQGIFHNLNRTDLDGITLEFQTNYADFAKKRRNGNKAVHVILSVNPLDREKMSVEIMDDLVNTYIQKTYPNALAFGTHHKSEQHWHSHLIVSANELMSKESTRLSKENLRSVHMEMLRYMREHHPSLTIGIDEQAWGKKEFSEKAYYKQKRNPELKLTREELSERIQGIFRISENSEQFYLNLREQGFATYNHRGRVQGILWSEQGKKMRFSRLGLKPEQVTELDLQHTRLSELDNMRMSSEHSSRNRDDFDRN